MDGERLVTLPHDDGVAAVVRTPSGEAFLSGDVRGGGGTGLNDHEPAVEGVGVGTTVAGGLLPPGAVAATVIDRAGAEHAATCGGGAWLALLPEAVRGETPVVRFLDEAGALVAVPLPDGVRVEPVTDAGEPCPACGAVDWGRVVAAPAHRYGEDGAGRPTAAVCARCGHTEHLGVLFAALDGEPPDEAELARARAEAAESYRLAVRTAALTVLSFADADVVVAGYGGASGRIDRVTLETTSPAGTLTVTTDAAEPWEAPAGLAHAALAALIGARDVPCPPGSDTAVSLWLNARRRASERAAAAARERTVQVMVDGVPTPFTCRSDGREFAAVARVGSVTVTVTGAGHPAGLSLCRVPAAEL